MLLSYSKYDRRIHPAFMPSAMSITFTSCAPSVLFFVPVEKSGIIRDRRVPRLGAENMERPVFIDDDPAELESMHKIAEGRYTYAPIQWPCRQPWSRWSASRRPYSCSISTCRPRVIPHRRRFLSRAQHSAGGGQRCWGLLFKSLWRASPRSQETPASDHGVSDQGTRAPR